MGVLQSSLECERVPLFSFGCLLPARILYKVSYLSLSASLIGDAVLLCGFFGYYV